MIIVSGTIIFNAAREAEAVELSAPLVATTRAEPGNLSYGMYLDPTAPGTLQIYEEWQDQAAIDTHVASEHMATFMAGLGAIEVSGVSIMQHEITSSKPLF